jgi:hypothetical protein
MELDRVCRPITASILPRLEYPEESVYCATKDFVVGFAVVMALEELP